MKHFRAMTVLVCLVMAVSLTSCLAGITPTMTPALDTSPSIGPTQSTSPAPTDVVAPTSETTSAPTEAEAITPGVTPNSSPIPTATSSPTKMPTKSPTTVPTIIPTMAPNPSPLTKANDFVTFGNCEQDNNLGNGKEPILWLVLAVNDGKALLLSYKSLDCKQYNATKISVTWETCTLRTWLNTDFLSASFNSEEQAAILTTTVTTPDNPNSGAYGGANTSDQIFLLSIGEVNSYFSTSAKRICFNTDYAKSLARAQGTYVDTGISNWFLRTPGYYNSNVAYVSYEGTVIESGTGVSLTLGAVRPALWLNLGS